MSLFFLKISLTPLLIASATLIARRWGPAVGGWFVGLPLTSAPVSLFLTLEQGMEFAAASAANSLTGLCGATIVSIVYIKSARGNAWMRSCCFSLGIYFLAMELLSLASLALLLACGMTLAFQLTALLVIGKPAAARMMRTSPWWDLPLRMGVAVTVVLSITGFAVALGPKWSGLLAPFPAFVLIMTAFSHQQHGPEAAHQVLYGIVAGGFSSIFFFCVVAFGLTSLGIISTFILATAVTCIVSGIAACIIRRM